MVGWDKCNGSHVPSSCYHSIVKLFSCFFSQTIAKQRHYSFLLLLQQGMIRTPQDLFLVHPLPARLGLEKNKTRAHVIQRRSLTPLQPLGMAMTEEERPEKWCGVKGVLSIIGRYYAMEINFHLDNVLRFV